MSAKVYVIPFFLKSLKTEVLVGKAENLNRIMHMLSSSTQILMMLIDLYEERVENKQISLFSFGFVIDAAIRICFLSLGSGTNGQGQVGSIQRDARKRGQS